MPLSESWQGLHVGGAHCILACQRANSARASFLQYFVLLNTEHRVCTSYAHPAFHMSPKGALGAPQFLSGPY